MLDKIVIPVLIFFNDKYETDEEVNIKYIKLLNQSVFKNIILLGTTSEGVLISFEDKVKIIKLYEKYLNKNINIILTPSVWAIKDFQYLINLSDRINNILFLPNSYFNRKEDELINYMNTLFHKSDKNIYLYNLPKNTLVDFAPSIVKKLLNKDLNIKGLKLSHSNNENIKLYKEFKNFNIFNIMYGSDKDIFLSFQMGADMVVSQNLSASLHITINELNIQETANNIRRFVSEKQHKIKALKQYIGLNDTVLI